MTELTENLAQAGNIMLLGMLIVFSFLTLLIGCVNGLSALIGKFFPDVPAPTATPKRQAPATGTAPAVVAAAAAAVQMHRNRTGSN